MLAYRTEFSISLMAEVFKVSRGAFYAWLKRGRGGSASSQDRLLQKIRTIHADSRGLYGSRRIHAVLRERGHKVNVKRVQRLMRAAGIEGHHARRQVQTTQRSHHAHGIEDHVQRDFQCSRANKLWVADSTYLPIAKGFAYLAMIMDAYSRQIVGWSFGLKHDAALMLRALRNAANRGPCGGVIHHSDQGSQYTSKSYQRACTAYGLVQSTGSVGDCYDNALAESWFATLKREMKLSEKVYKASVLKDMLMDYIEGFYNTRRLHSALGYLSPVRYAKEARAAS